MSLQSLNLNCLIRQPELDDLNPILKSGSGRLLQAIFKRLALHGKEEQLLRSLPHFQEDLSFDDLRAVLFNLGFETNKVEAQDRKLLHKLTPLIHRSRSGLIELVVGFENKHALVLSAGAEQPMRRLVSTLKGDFYCLQKTAEQESARVRQHGWIFSILLRFRPLLTPLLVASFFSNLMGLATPLFIMVIYDQVVPASGQSTLAWLLAGLAVALCCDLGFKSLRAGALAWLGARMESEVGCGILNRLLSLPTALIEQSPVNQQVAQLKQFETLRDFFTGTFANLLLDLPFLFLFLGIIALVGGEIALVPLALLAVFLLLTYFMMPWLRTVNAEAARLRTERQAFLIEVSRKQQAIQQLGAIDIWANRYRTLSAENAEAQRRLQLSSAYLQAIAQGLMALGGVATLTWGALLVVNGQLSGGALIAVMALTWKVLSPLKIGFLSLTRLEQILTVLRQVNRLASLAERYSSQQGKTAHRAIHGDLAIEGISYRYPGSGALALASIKLRIPSGQFLAIAGENNSGKSTLLKLIAGRSEANSGRLLIDGMDAKQMNEEARRHSISYLSADSQLFYGTLRQNLHLANPLADDKDLQESLRLAGLQDHPGLPQGLNTRLNEAWLEAATEGLKKQIMLARCFTSRAPILLLDEPGTALDHAASEQLAASLAELKGKVTIIMTSHRPSHIQLADRLVVLKDGQVKADGKPAELMQRGL